MRLKTLGLLVLVLVLGIFLVGSVKSHACEVRLATDCTTAPWNVIVMRLSDEGNAHGALWDYLNYDWVVCCDEDFAGYTQTCDGSNAIIRLSDTFNAHAESPNLAPNYGTEVCLQHMECVYTNDLCDTDYPLLMFTLPSGTNVHIGDSSFYTGRICCNDTNFVPELHCIIDVGQVICTEPDEVCDLRYGQQDYSSQVPPDERPCCDACCDPITIIECNDQNPPWGWCGVHDNDCGGTVNCGSTCDAGECCNMIAGGYCYAWDDPCNPPNNDFECGWHTDNCLIDRDCGTCPTPGNICEMPARTCCTPLTQPEACEAAYGVGYECGNAPVGCGLPEVSCGTCDDPQYPICQSGTCVEEPEKCTITGVYWINDSSNSAPIMEGEIVQLGVDASTNCSGEIIFFEVFEQTQGSGVVVTHPAEDEPGGGIFFTAPGPGMTTWKAEYHNDTNDDGEWPEYYIKAEISGITSLLSTAGSGTGYALLFVEDNETIFPWDCTGITLCSDYTDPGNCTSDWCGVADWSVNVTDGKGCGITGCGNGTQPNLWYSDCGCEWTGDEATGSCGPIRTDNPCTDCGNGIREQGEVCDTLDFSKPGGGDWICDDFDEYSGGTLLCTSNCTLNFTLCGGYEVCDYDDVVDSGEVCDGTNLSKPGGGNWACTDFDDFIGGALGCVDCNFDYSNCFTGGPSEPPIGNCHLVTDPVNGCDDDPIGLLTTSWAGWYEWDPANAWGTEPDCIADSLCDGSLANPCNQTPVGVGDWHCNFERAYDFCVAGGSATMECPAEIQLLFFGKYQIIVSVLLIASIYGFIVFRKRN
jgi:hypothetical protein